MKKDQIIKSALLVLSFAGLAGKGYAQDPIYIGGAHFIGASDKTQWYGDVTFGPDAVVYIEDGAAPVFYGNNMIVSPGAQFLCYPSMTSAGTGKIVFMKANPNTGLTVQQTLNGGNSTALGGAQPTLPNIEINNTAGVQLTGSNTRIANMVTFTAGHLFLAGQDLEMSSAATFSGYDNTRYVATNGTGHIAKEGQATGASFVYPVGMATPNYTPATVTNTSGAANNYFVQVKDYAGSASTENVVSEGMDRSWHIYSTNAGTATLALQHNNATNGSSFNSASAFVTQQTATGIWSTGTVAAGTVGIPSGTIHTRTGMTLANTTGAITSWFTKAGDAITPLLSPNLSPAISFTPSVVAGTTNVAVVLDVYEVNNSASTGPVSVYILKDPNFTLAFNPTATTVGGQSVNNSSWTFDATTNPLFYILTTSAFAANGQRSAGFTTTITPGASSGKTVISAIIPAGSGGDTVDTDNADDDTLIYTP